MTEFKFNINNKMKVKLTNLGVTILKKRHDDNRKAIFDSSGYDIGDFNLELDEDGWYYVNQAWWLMKEFGEYMSPGIDVMFEPDIILVNGESTDNQQDSDTLRDMLTELNDKRYELDASEYILVLGRVLDKFEKLEEI